MSSASLDLKDPNSKSPNKNSDENNSGGESGQIKQEVEGQWDQNKQKSDEQKSWNSDQQQDNENPSKSKNQEEDIDMSLAQDEGDNKNNVDSSMSMVMSDNKQIGDLTICMDNGNEVQSSWLCQSTEKQEYPDNKGGSRENNQFENKPQRGNRNSNTQYPHYRSERNNNYENSKRNYGRQFHRQYDGPKDRDYQNEPRNRDYQYQSGQRDYQSGQRDYQSGQRDYQSGQRDYQSGQRDRGYQNGQRDYQSGQRDYQNGQRDYQNGQRDYHNGLRGGQNQGPTRGNRGNKQYQQRKYGNYENDPFKKKEYMNSNDRGNRGFNKSRGDQKPVYCQVENLSQNNEKEPPKLKTEQPKQNKITREQQLNIKPIGQKCWPEISIFIKGTKVTFTYRQLNHHASDILIIPYRDLKFEVYPGNIINVFDFDYRKKIKDKGDVISKPGQIYCQKCIGLPNFKALGFLKINTKDDLSLCFKNVFMTAKKLKEKISTILIPYSKDLGPSKLIIYHILNELSQNHDKQYDKVEITTNKPEDFLEGLVAFSEQIKRMSDANEIFISQV